MHTVNRSGDSRSVSMAATELLVFLLHWVGCLPACLPACLSACLSICLFVCWDWHDSQSRKSRQDAEVSHAPWWNTSQPWGQHSSDSLPYDILLLFHLNGVTHRTLWGPFPSAVLIKYNLLMPRMYGSWGELTIHCSCGQMGTACLHYS